MAVRPGGGPHQRAGAGRAACGRPGTAAGFRGCARGANYYLLGELLGAGRRLALPPSRAGAAPASAASPQAPGSLSCCGFHRTGERGAPWKGRHSGGNKRKNDENERRRAGGRHPRRGPGGGGERGAGRVTCHRSSWECEVQPWRPAVCTCGRGLSRRGRVRGGRTALGFGEVAPLPAGAPSAVPAPARSVTGRAVPLPVPAGRSPPVQTTHREPRPFGEIST